MNQQLLTIEDVCRELSVGKHTVYQLCQTGELKSFKLGRRIVIHQYDLNTFIDSLKNGAKLRDL